MPAGRRPSRQIRPGFRFFNRRAFNETLESMERGGQSRPPIPRSSGSISTTSSSSMTPIGQKQATRSAPCRRTLPMAGPQTLPAGGGDEFVVIAHRPDPGERVCPGRAVAEP